MNIAPAIETELPALLEVFNAARESAVGLSHRPVSLDEFMEQVRGETILIARVDGEVAGFAAIWERKNFIHHLYVAPPCQGRGVGKALLDECRRRFGLPLWLKSVAENRRACAFYERNGWLPKGTGVGRDGPYISYCLDRPAC